MQLEARQYIEEVVYTARGEAAEKEMSDGFNSLIARLTAMKDQMRISRNTLSTLTAARLDMEAAPDRRYTAPPGYVPNPEGPLSAPYPPPRGVDWHQSPRPDPPPFHTFSAQFPATPSNPHAPQWTATDPGVNHPDALPGILQYPASRYFGADYVERWTGQALHSMDEQQMKGLLRNDDPSRSGTNRQGSLSLAKHAPKGLLSQSDIVRNLSGNLGVPAGRLDGDVAQTRGHRDADPAAVGHGRHASFN